ncbi:MAG TPA: Y-family DNA polymerase [bacterium]|nr:Y-family DNA polymerase [bacterium]
MNKKNFALIDCNNFYASCERAFDPSLKNKPVVILSNNDGCIVSRSDEAKKIGIPMGAPLFKFGDLIMRHKVAVLSSNYSLYADMSNRVMSVITESVPDYEIYSIDECFLDLTDFPKNKIAGYMAELKKKVYKCVGVPVSVGIGSTKTLAKFANSRAKKNAIYSGVFDIDSISDDEKNELLKNAPVSDIWGIGLKLSAALEKRGISNAFQLKTADRRLIKKILHIQGLRTVLELNGESCISLEDNIAPKKNIVSSRSFGKPVTEYGELKQAVICYAETAAEKMRAQNSAASAVGVFITTNRFAEPDKKYYNSSIINLESPTAYSPDLIKTALINLERIFKKGFIYKKAGVYLLDLTDDSCLQQNLFNENSFYSDKKRKLMGIIDFINNKSGGNHLKISAAGTNRLWEMKREKKSKAYTTKWNELPIVKLFIVFLIVNISIVFFNLIFKI